MRLDAHLVIAAVCVFTRCTAMLMSAPIAGNAVPVSIRLMIGVVLSLSLVPVLHQSIGPVPDNVIGLFLMIVREALVGLLIGGVLQLLVSAAQMAGSFVDVQIGTGSAQIFNPYFGGSASPVGNLKMMLTVVLILLLNGQRMMVGAFVQSYHMPGPTLNSVHAEVIPLMGQLSMVALQIAAPVAAVSVIIDAAAGIVNKAVPQTQPFLLSLPAKLAAGIVVLSIGLPALVTAVQSGLDVAFDHLGHMLRGG